MEKSKKFVLAFFLIVLNCSYYKHSNLLYLMAHTSVQSTHFVGPRTEILTGTGFPKIGIMSEYRHGKEYRFRIMQRPSVPSQTVPWSHTKYCGI